MSATKPPRGWRDVPTKHQAYVLRRLEHHEMPFVEAQKTFHSSVLNACYVRGWIGSENGRMYLKNGGLVALERYRERHGEPMP